MPPLSSIQHFSFTKDTRYQRKRKNLNLSPDTKVQFFEKVKVRTIESHKDWTQQEREATWYNPRELQKIRKACTFVVKY